MTNQVQSRRVRCAVDSPSYFSETLKRALANPQADQVSSATARGPEVRDAKSRPSGFILRDGLRAYRINAQLQAEYADLIHTRFIRELEGHGIRVVGQVHDELILERDEHDTLPPFEVCVAAAERSTFGEKAMSESQMAGHVLSLTEQKETVLIHDGVSQHFESVTEAPERKYLSDLTEVELKAMEDDLRAGSLTAQEIADKYWLRNAGLVQARKARLGLTKAHGPAAPVAHPVIDYDEEIALAEKRLAELKARKAEQAIKFDWLENTGIRLPPGNDFLEYCDGKVLVSGVGANFRAAGGFAKFRAWVEKEVSQVGAPPNAMNEAIDRTTFDRALALINQHLSGNYVDLDDALRNLLQGYVTMRDNAREATELPPGTTYKPLEPPDVWIVLSRNREIICGVFSTEVGAHNYRSRELNGDAHIIHWQVRKV